MVMGRAYVAYSLERYTGPAAGSMARPSSVLIKMELK